MSNKKKAIPEEVRRYIIDNFERALSEGWISACYQPIVRGSNGRVCSEEALARWKEPGKAAIYPDEFVPVLEDAGLIYRLDLYMIDQIIEGIDKRREAGLLVLPISVNLSRVDFDSCDIVEEVRRKVDDAGIERQLLTIEITESVLGSDFERITAEIKRLRGMGFRVCMDDFGSGYSTLDFLQKIDVDALKLDLNFMREFDSNHKTRIIVTMLMRLISALGMDTVAEGVETEEQFEFLREIGCAKMQGYYFCEAVPLDEIIARYEEGRQIGFEDPDETGYYETIGRISLFDLDELRDDSSNEDTTALLKYFSSLPVAILEYNGETVRTARCNRSYKLFLEEAFGITASGRDYDHSMRLHEKGAGIFELFERCRGLDHRVMFEERLSDRININGYIKHSADNEVSGYSAFTIVILSSRDYEDNSGVTFSRAAKALSADYVNLYYVNTLTDEFIEYNPDAERSNLSVERHGTDFFNASRNDALKYIYPGDQERFLQDFSKENILSILGETGTFSLSYRLMTGGDPIYVNLKAVGVDSEHIVIGVNNVDAYMRHKEALDRAREESITYARITALAGNYIAIYTVDPVTDDYVEYVSTKEFEHFGLAKTGTDFFGDIIRNGRDAVHADDFDGYQMVCTKENIMRDIEQTGLFELNYRLVLDGETVHVSLKAALVEEKDGPRLIVGLSNIQDRIQRNMEYEASLREARVRITTDSLTGVKNKAAYLDAEADLNGQIIEGWDLEFAIVVADLNGLKDINDQHGHQTGDNFLKAGCRAICDIFDHSPVYRVGGDEFAVIARGRDYEHIDELMEEMAAHNERCIEAGKMAADGMSEAKQMAIHAGTHDRDIKVDRSYEDANAGAIYEIDPADVVVACGMARYHGDPNVAAVFDRADLAMFENKKYLKSR